MKFTRIRFAARLSRLGVIGCVCLGAGVAALARADHNWPQFRGPNSSGVSEEPAPVTWDVESGANIRWQAPIPGLGHASPIVWGDHIFVTTAVKPGAKSDLKVGLYGDIGSYTETEAHQWRIISLNKADGKIVWDKLVLESIPRTKRHTKSTHCNSTPSTDGKRIAAIFGSEGLYCFDMDGKELWHTNLGRMDSGYYVVPSTSWGFASSPLLHDGKVIVQCDVLSEQYLAAFDAADGHQVWRTTRKDVPTWSTPVIATTSGRTQIIVNGLKQIGGYDFSNGAQLWTLKEGGDIPVASPILASNLVVLTSAHGPKRPIRAVRLDASGDITPPEFGATNQAIAWCQPRKGTYLETPIALAGLVWVDLDGVLTCLDAGTGEIQYNERIGGGGQGFTASPVAANGKIYFTGEQGDVFVLPATRTFSVLATNKLGGICLATPAISDGTLFYRTTEKLLAIGAKK